VDRELAERNWMDFALPAGILVAILALGWAGLRFMQKSPTSPSAADLIEAIEHPAASPAAQAAPARRVAPEPVVASAVDVVTVYQCVQNGRKVISDRPCGPRGTAHALDGSSPRTDHAVRSTGQR
jgi:hypothetical protein